MNPAGSDALELALAVRAVPARLPEVRSRPLPGTMLVLLELVGGRRETIERCAAATMERPQVLVEAATLFIQQVLFDEDADHYRVLGVRPDATLEAIREHHRWLMRWLHPDRDGGRWETAFSERVNAAWNVLRVPERRREYDQWLADHPHRGRSPAAIDVAALRSGGSGTVLSPQMVRRLPAFTLVGLALASAGALVMMGSGRIQLPVPDGSADVDRPATADDIAARVVRETMGTEGGLKKKDGAPPRSDATPIRAPMEASGAGPAASAPIEPIDPAGTQRNTAADSLDAGSTSGVQQGHPPVAGNDTRSVASIIAPPPSMGTTNQLSQPASTTTIHHDAASRNPVEGTGRPAKHDLASDAGESSINAPNDADSRAIPAWSSPTAAAPPSGVSSRHAAVARSGSGPGRTAVQQTTPASVVASSVARLGEQTAIVRSKPSQTAPVAAPPAMTARDASQAIPRAFAAAYAQGDPARITALFTPDAMENRDGIQAIARNYRTFFDTTSSRQLNLDGLSWTIKPDRIIGTGAFEASLRLRSGAGIRRVKGWIRIEAVPVGKDWKIEYIQHEERR